MTDTVKHIAGLQDWLFHLLYEHNEIVYVILDDNNHPLIRLFEKDNCRYVTIYQNRETLTLIKGVKNVGEYRFRALLNWLDKDIRIEALDSGVYQIRNTIER